MDKREKNNSILDMLKDYVDEQRQLSFGVELGGTPAVVGSIAREYDFVLEIIESFEETESGLIDQLDEPEKVVVYKERTKIAVFDSYSNDVIGELNNFISDKHVIDIKHNTVVSVTGAFFTTYLVIYKEED